MSSITVAIALAASEPSAVERIERRAGILAGIGFAFALGGGVALGVGVHSHEDRFSIGGAALIGLSLHLLALAAVAYLWPDDAWLGLLVEQTDSGSHAWLGAR